MTKPNFFIVGAPKCATTALTTYLDRHPEVGIVGKEIHVFGRDLEFRRRRATLDQYLALAAPLAHLPAVGDASVYYLFSRSAAEEIKQFCPEARIIIMLRNPVDVLHSLHGQLLKTADEDIEDFEGALAAEPDRAAGRRIPRSIHAVHALRYRRIVAFSEQVERYLRVFGREQVLILLYDDLARDPAAVFRTTLEFLGVDPDFHTTFERINEAQQLRFRKVREIQKNLPSGLVLWLRQTMPRPVRAGLVGLFTMITYRNAKRPPMRPELRTRLLEEYRGEIDRLGALIGRDLSGWYVRAGEDRTSIRLRAATS